MSGQNDGGPVFPQTHEQRYLDPVHGVIRPKDIYGDAHPGMSLRDYFAGQSLGESCGVVAAMADYPRAAKEEAERIAQAAYLIADAMLAERSKSEAP
jgi:hypothetical protein